MPMEYKYILSVKESVQEPDRKCPEANSDGWAQAQVNRGFFPTTEDAIAFLESHRGITKGKGEGIFKKVNTGDLNEPD